MQAIQTAQQFAASLGLGRQPTAPAPGAVSPGDGGGQPASPSTPPAPVTGAPPGSAAAVTPAAAAMPVAGVTAPYPSGPFPQQAGFDQLAWLLQALRQHQIPALPGPTGAPAMPSVPAAAPSVGAPAAPGMAAAPQASALGLLRVILSNPQLQQALQAPAAVPRTVPLPMPVPGAPGQMAATQVPLGAVMNAIALLAGQSMTELNEFVSEEEPEIPDYLVDDRGDFIVDPASADDRAALVTHLFRLSNAAQQQTWDPPLDGRPDEGDDELDECDEWVRAVGL